MGRNSAIDVEEFISNVNALKMVYNSVYLENYLRDLNNHPLQLEVYFNSLSNSMHFSDRINSQACLDAHLHQIPEFLVNRHNQVQDCLDHNHKQILEYLDKIHQQTSDCLVLLDKINHLYSPNNFHQILSQTRLNLLLHSKHSPILIKINNQ